MDPRLLVTSRSLYHCLEIDRHHRSEMLGRRIEVDSERRYVKMKKSSFFSDEKYIHRFVARTVSIAELVVYVGSLACKIADNELSLFNQLSDLRDYNASASVLVDPPTSKAQFPALILDCTVCFIHICTAKGHDYKDETFLKTTCVRRIIIGSAELAIHKGVLAGHNLVPLRVTQPRTAPHHPA